jgi:hypothetical protein
MSPKYGCGRFLFLATTTLFSSIFLAVSGSVIKRNMLPSALVEFELAFSETLDYKLSGSIKLIGYTTIRIPPDEIESFEAHYDKHYTEWRNISNIYYEKGSGMMRAYFPVQGALVEHHNTVIEANYLGELNIPGGNVRAIGLAVLGRKQTDNIRGVEHNIIKDGIIYLARKNTPHHRIENVFVFGFGEKVLGDHHDGLHEKRNNVGPIRASVPCMKNHGGPNCSDKFKIYKGRCPFVATWCMDYNGPASDCVKVFGIKTDPKVGLPLAVKFVGSDCNYALYQGHCWNENM